jgi:hypothetical protein
MQLPVTSQLTSGNFSDAEANILGVVRRRTLFGGVKGQVKFEFIRVIKVKKNEMEVSCGGEERRGANRMLERKPEEKRSRGRPRRSWKDNIKSVLKKSAGTT